MCPVPVVDLKRRFANVKTLTKHYTSSYSAEILTATFADTQLYAYVFNNMHKHFLNIFYTKTTLFSQSKTTAIRLFLLLFFKILIQEKHEDFKMSYM